LITSFLSDTKGLFVEIGIDVGGTKTHVLIANDDATEHEFVIPTSDWRVGSLLEDPGNITRLVQTFSHLIPRPEITPLVVGAHGCDSEDMRVEFQRLLHEAYAGPVQALNDAALLANACGIPHAISLIVGTGSIVFGTDARGNFIVTGGYGAILGDPGSAPALVREAIRAVLIAHDSGKPLDPLGIMLMEHYRASDLPELALNFSSEILLTRWGGAASVIFDAAAQGSALALQVVDRAAAELAVSVHDAVAKGALGTTVIAAGGVVTNQVLMLERISHHIGVVEPNLDLIVLREPPVRGALALAHQLSQQNSTIIKGERNEEQKQTI
jgi:glucosamine kinase